MRNRVVMFHIGRCGSTVLGNMLNRHTQCHWEGELLLGPSAKFPQEPHGGAKPWHPWCQSAYFPKRPLEFIESRAPPVTRSWFGFEVQFYQLGDNCIALEQFVEHMESIGFARFIVLTRRNYLRVVASNLMAMAKSEFHIGAGTTPEFRTIRINVDAVYPGSGSLRSVFGWFDAWVSEARLALRGEGVLSLSYEDHIRDSPRVAYHLACEFLGIQPAELPIEFARTTPWDLRSFIENFDDVAAVLRGTPYEWMTAAGE